MSSDNGPRRIGGGRLQCLSGPDDRGAGGRDPAEGLFAGTSASGGTRSPTTPRRKRGSTHSRPRSAPIAVLGGWSSDRAKELADAMRDANWSGTEAAPVHLAGDRGRGVLAPTDNYPVGYVRRSSSSSTTARSGSASRTSRWPRPSPTLSCPIRHFARAGRCPNSDLRQPATPRDSLALEDDDCSIDRSVPAFSIEWKDDPHHRLERQVSADSSVRGRRWGFDIERPARRFHSASAD